MRNEIERAVAAALGDRERGRLGRFRLLFQAGGLSPEQRAALISPGHAAQLALAETRFAEIERCLAPLVALAAAYRESPAAWRLCWDGDDEHWVAVRLSLYGALAWVEERGRPPGLLLAALADCLRAQGLLALEPAELAALREAGRLELLF
ncbi:MAG TPA: hypothetical protein VGE07_24605 [Herpetosiphonaceae bacterium]